MSKAELNKIKCTLSDNELINKSNEWVSKLAKSGGTAWVLRIPVDFNHDPDMLFVELGKRLESLSTENTQLKEASRICKVALRIIVDGDPISVGLDEIEQICNNTIDAVDELLNTEQNGK